jgi:hypothetical protein
MNRQPATRASRRMTLRTSIVATASEPSAIAFATPARASTTAKPATSLGGRAKTRPLGLAAPNLRRISGRPVPALEENAATAIGASTESRCAAPRPDGLSSKRRVLNSARDARLHPAPQNASVASTSTAPSPLFAFAPLRASRNCAYRIAYIACIAGIPSCRSHPIVALASDRGARIARIARIRSWRSHRSHRIVAHRRSSCSLRHTRGVHAPRLMLTGSDLQSAPASTPTET